MRCCRRWMFTGSTDRSALGGSQKSNCVNFLTGLAVPAGDVSDGRIRRRCCTNLFNSIGAGQGRRIQPDDSDSQSVRAVGAGALADGVPPGGAAAGAALHADPHAGGECAVCADQRPRAGAGGAARRRITRSRAWMRNRRSCTSALRRRPMCCSRRRNPGHGGEQPDRAHAAYAKDRAGLYQMLASTLQHYGINLDGGSDRDSGESATTPVVQGVDSRSSRGRCSQP